VTSGSWKLGILRIPHTPDRDLGVAPSRWKKVYNDIGLGIHTGFGLPICRSLFPPTYVAQITVT